MDINISIVEKHPSVEGTPVIVCENSGYNIIFNFDEEWESSPAKTARFVFTRDGVRHAIDIPFTDNAVEVPILTDIVEVFVGVYTDNLRTTTPTRIPCEKSIRCGTAISDEPTPSQYDKIIELINSKVTPGNGDSDYVPSYWKPELDTAVEATRRTLESAGRNKSAFFFYTDSHYKPSTGSGTTSPVLLKHLYKNTPINKTVYGGDVVIQEAEAMADMPYLYERMSAIRGLPNHHSVHGNHDDGNDVENRYTGNEVYAYMMAPEETPDIVRGGDFYYYIDDVNERTRYLYLDTASYDDMVLYNAEQLQFVVDALSSTPEKWHIIPIAHIWYEPGENSDYNNPVLRYNANLILPVLDKYNARGTGTAAVSDNRETYTAISYDFTEAAGKIEFCIGGHLHRDFDGSSPGGIPVIICMGDGNPARDGDPAIVPGTTTEASVSAIVADYANSQVHIIRAGRGEGRIVVLPEQETPTEPSEPETETPVNLLSTAKLTDGTTVKNEVGYQDGQYVSGGASEQIRWSADANYWASGIIEWDIVNHDTIIIDGWNPDGTSHSRWRCTSEGYDGNIGVPAMENIAGIAFFNSISAADAEHIANSDDFYYNWKVSMIDNNPNKVAISPIDKFASVIEQGNVSKIWFAISLPGSGADVTITYAE